MYALSFYDRLIQCHIILLYLYLALVHGHLHSHVTQCIIYIFFYILYILFKFYFLVVVFFFFFVQYLIVSFLNDPFINSHRVFGFAFSLNVAISVIVFLMHS